MDLILIKIEINKKPSIRNTYSKKFLEIAKIYFMDCPELIDSIENKEFSRYGIRDVVEYYKSYCR